MACRQACNRGYTAPVADYLLQPIANDNRPPVYSREWFLSTLGIAACTAAQYVWATFLLWQMQN